MMKKVAVLPALMTLGNLIAGFTALGYLMDAGLGVDAGPEGLRKISIAAWLVFLGMIFDGLDGRIARLTRSTSKFGAQLDSLGDLITFGVVPAMLVRAVAKGFFLNPKILWLICVLYPVCAALRLARFNVDHSSENSKHDEFEGFPSPAAAGVIAALVLLALSAEAPFGAPDAWGRKAIFLILPFVELGVSALMISTIPYVHVMNRFVGDRKPFPHIVALVFFGILAAYLIEATLALAFCVYALWGPVSLIFPKLNSTLKESTEKTREEHG